jgi:hypothetical protein
MKKLIVIAILLAGCSKTASDQGWVLQTYDEKTGYTFTKNRVTYEANCEATGVPMLYDKPDASPDSLPPFSAEGNQSACTSILPYIHKTIPIRQVGGAILLFDVPHGASDQTLRLEFTIKHAK